MPQVNNYLQQLYNYSKITIVNNYCKIRQELLTGKVQKEIKRSQEDKIDNKIELVGWFDKGIYKNTKWNTFIN